MKKNYNIFVEGVADERFFKQYISHVSGEEVEDERLVKDSASPDYSCQENENLWLS